MLRNALAFWAVALLLASTGTAAHAAEVLLDKPLRVGDLIVFPSRSDGSKFYYAPIKAHLAKHPNGMPQFSFLRWVRNVQSESGEDDIDEGEGGGIVHAVVRLGLTGEEFAQAKEDLEALRPGGTLEGPIVYNEGRFALVSSFAGDNGELTRQLVGTGQAPILEGGKASISLFLTKAGAKILWQSFQTTTPDISFLFDMELEGYRSPVEAVLEADFDQVYKHRSFNLDANAAASLDVAAAIPVDKVAAALGAPIPVPIDVGVAGHVGGLFSAQIERIFDELRQDGSIRITYVGDDAGMKKAIDQSYTELRKIMFEANFVRAGNTGPAVTSRSLISRGGKGKSKGKGKGKGSEKGSKGKNRASQEAALAQAASKIGSASATTGAPQSSALPSQVAATAKKEKTGKGKEERPTSKPKEDKKKADDRKIDLPRVQSSGCSGLPTSGVGGGSTSGAGIQASVSLDVCVSMKYTQKKRRHRGTYRLDMRKFTASTLRVPFAENIGDLRVHLEDPSVFRSVNLDDPLYRQREIVASVNGVDASDFGTYLNSVAVILRKQHDGGDKTIDDERIDATTFTRKGNEFKLLYGWKGDTDRDRWMDYEYRTLWSFAGGSRVESPWVSTSFPVIPLDPPFERRSIRLEGSPEYLEGKPVRSITVRIYYDAGGVEKTEQVTLMADRGDLSRRIELILPTGVLDYEYEIRWRLRGNKTLTTGRLPSSDDILYVDELPEV